MVSSRERGTVVLVALCFVAVLGLMLASYLAVSSRAMQLSNRSLQSEQSRQLAEAGIEEALRAFNQNNWDDWSSSGMSVDWTLDATNKRATATISYPSSKFAQGTTATVKVRVDNYDAQVLGAKWVNTKTYRINDLIEYNGIWYRSVRDNNTGQAPADSSQNPNLSWWVPAPIPWMWSNDNTYYLYDFANYNGVWYRYYATSGNSTPGLDTDGTTSDHWAPIPTMSAWASGIHYKEHDVVAYTASTGEVGVYRCITEHSSTSSFSADMTKWSSAVHAITLDWEDETVYTRGAITFYEGAWYFCHTSGTSSTAPDSDASMWALVIESDGDVDTSDSNNWVSERKYFVGDFVYRSGWKRCTEANSDSSFDSDKWDASGNDRYPFPGWSYRNSNTYVVYRFNDVTYYGSSSSKWYRWINANISTNWSSVAVPTSTSYWEPALAGDNTSSSPGALGWSSSSVNYSIGDSVYYNAATDSQWFRCIRAHTSSTSIRPTNTDYWTDTPHFSTEWQPNHQYSAYDVVRYKGIWFLSLQNSNHGNLPMAADSSWWAAAPRDISPWQSGKPYNFDDLVSHGGSWYRCIWPHSGEAPSAYSSYWTVLTGSGNSYVWSTTTSAPTGSYRSYGGAWFKCLTGNTGESPNNSAYWTPTWRQSWQEPDDGTGAPVVYAQAEITLGDNTTSRTQLRASIDLATLFPNALAATSQLSIGGGTVGTIDSYDGSVRAMNTGGTADVHDYSTDNSPPFNSASNANISFSATLATGGTTSGSLSIGASTTVKGFATANSATTSPFAPLISFGSSASLRNEDNSIISTHPTASNVDLARVGRSPYIPDFEIIDGPNGTALSTTAARSATLGTPGAVAPSTYRVSGSVTLSTTSGTPNVLNIVGPVTLTITSNLRVNSNSLAKINITPTGSLRLIVGRDFRLEAAGGGIRNLTLDPKKLSVLLTRSGTDTFEISNPSSTNGFIGTLYMPDSSSALTVASNAQIYGALSAQSITFSGAANLHYDTSLRYATFPGVDQPYTVTELRELPAGEQATMP